MEPLEITWNLADIKKYFTQISNGKEKYQQLKDVIFKANALLRLYFKIPPFERNNKQFTSSNPTCRFHQSDYKKYNTHMTMKLQILTDPEQLSSSTIARAISCFKNNKQRTLLGSMQLKIDNFVGDQITPAQNFDNVLTIVHETIHAMGFELSNLYHIDKNSPNLIGNNLLIFARKHNPNILFYGHWKEEILPNELMISKSRSGLIMTQFTLELINFLSPMYLIQRKNLPENLHLERIQDLQDYLSYYCASEPSFKPKYFNYCSQEEYQNQIKLCSLDYRSKTYCTLQSNDNNCHLRRSEVEDDCLSTLPQNSPNKNVIEKMGIQSRCFNSDTRKSAYCLNFKVENQRLSIIIEGIKYECLEDNYIIEHKHLNWKDQKTKINYLVRCPVINDFLKQLQKTDCQDNCNWNGFCSGGKCICFEGFDPKDRCKFKLAQNRQGLFIAE